MSTLRRRLMLGGKSLPYDAEIMYLQSDGNAYIDTQYAQKDVSKFSIKYYNTSSGSPSWGNAMGCRTSTSSNEFLVCNASRGIISIGSRNTSMGNTVSRINEIIYNGGSSISVNGTSKSVGTSSLSRTDSVVLFANRDNGRVIEIQAGRIYYVKLEGNGKSLDLILVRVGNVGYMYDKVSGKLFGNMGTGNFVLGNDKLPLPDNLVWVQLYNTSTGKFGVNRYVPIYGIIQKQSASSSSTNRMGYTWRKNELYYSNDEGINGSGWNSITISGDDTTLFHLWLDPYNRNVAYKDEKSGGSGWQSYSSYPQETVELVNGSSVTSILIADADSDEILYFGEAQRYSNPEYFYVRIKQEDYNANGYTISIGERIPAL